MIKNEDIEVLKEKFPHIAFKIRTLWGSPQMNKYFETLLSDTSGRAQERKGFPIEIALLLMKLFDKHHEDFPEFVSDDDGIWTKNKKII